MLKMYIAGLTHALHPLHLVAQLRKHAENHLLHQAARAQAQGGERAYAPTPTHNPTDPPQPSSTAPKASSDGGASTTASCCRTRASPSPCRRAAWSPAGARSTAAPAVVWRGKGAGLRRRVLEAGDSVGSLPILAPDAQPSQTSWSSAARKGPKTRRKPPAATSCVKMRELKLKRESEQTRVRTHKLDRPAAAFRHPTDGKL